MNSEGPYRRNENTEAPAPPSIRYEKLDDDLTFWSAIAVAVASCPNCIDKEAPIKWADYMLDARRKRFGRPT